MAAAAGRVAPLSHAQRALLAEVDAADAAALRAHAPALVARVALLVERRALVDADVRALHRRLVVTAEALRRDPADASARAAVWSLVEAVTHRPWGIGAQGAIDRLVVAGAIADAVGAPAQT